MKYVEFGTGGWRGIIGDKYTKENVRRVIYSCLDEIKEQGVIVARDRRFLSEESVEWVLEVLCAYDKKVYVVEDVIPTPTLMHAVKQNKFDLGIMITASHNPSQFNGIKIITEGGRDAGVILTEQLEVKANQVDTIKTVKVDKSMYETIRPNNSYIQSVSELIDVKSIRDMNYRVAVDIMHSVSYRVLPMILGNIGVEFDIIRDKRDPLFDNDIPNPSEMTLKKLKLLMEKNDYDIGIATDADGDRIGLLDEKGNYVHANMILSILYKFLLDSGEKGAIVRNISTTHLVDVIAQDYGQIAIEEPVGFKNISESMIESNALMGGESSGGITTRNHIAGKDGIYSSILVLEMMSYYKKPLSLIIEEMENQYGKYYFIEREFVITLSQYKGVLDKIMNTYKQNKEVQINTLDGIKIVYSDNSWVSFRKSGTEDLCRLFIESKDKDRIEELEQEYVNYIEWNDNYGI